MSNGKISFMCLVNFNAKCSVLYLVKHTLGRGFFICVCHIIYGFLLYSDVLFFVLYDKNILCLHNNKITNKQKTRNKNKTHQKTKNEDNKNRKKNEH